MGNGYLRTVAARGAGDIPFGVAPPLGGAIHQSTVGVHPDLVTSDRLLSGEEHGYSYYRFGHHNGDQLDSTVAALEGAEAAVSAASGMAAISAIFLANSVAGDHVIVDTNAYGGTRVMCETDLPRFGVDVSFVDLTDIDAVAAAVTPKTTMLFIEAMSNPTLRVPDLDALTALAADVGITTAVDATFVSPAVLQPIAHGADLVVHSIPKYLGGHSVAMGGIVSGPRERIDEIRHFIIRSGGTLGPFDAWLAHLGIKTLPLRMAAHSENAIQIAAVLDSHGAVRETNHPSLVTHPDHEVALRLCPNGTGGMLSFTLAEGFAAASAFIAAVHDDIPLAPSLGDVATTVSHPASSSHRNLDASVRESLGIGDGLLRLSVGIEDGGDLVSTITTALDRM